MGAVSRDSIIAGMSAEKTTYTGAAVALPTAIKQTKTQKEQHAVTVYYNNVETRYLADGWYSTLHRSWHDGAVKRTEHHALPSIGNTAEIFAFSGPSSAAPESALQQIALRTLHCVSM